jgi:hypothetical protein
MQVPSLLVGLSVPAIKDILQREFDNIVPGWYCPVDVKIGKPGQSWGELEEI